MACCLLRFGEQICSTISYCCFSAQPARNNTAAQASDHRNLLVFIFSPFIMILLRIDYIYASPPPQAPIAFFPIECRWAPPLCHTTVHTEFTEKNLHYLSDYKCADVDEVHLSAVEAVGRINDDASAIGAEARMRIAAPFTLVFGRRIEAAKRDFLARCDIVEINVLFSLFVGIGVVENPFVARQVAAMSVLGHNGLAHDFDLAGAVFI